MLTQRDLENINLAREMTERSRRNYETARGNLISLYESGRIGVEEFDAKYKTKVLPLKQETRETEQAELVTILSFGIETG